MSAATTAVDAPRFLDIPGPATWQVPSRTRAEVFYHVTRRRHGALTCTCTAAAFGRDCHHRRLVEQHLGGPHPLESFMTITDIARSPHNGGPHELSALTIWTDEETRVIKEQIAGGMSPPITDAELRYFASVCQARRLSPIAGQIVPVRRGGRMVIQVTIHGLRSIADATGDYAPGPRSTFEGSSTGDLVSATAYVMKHARGQWHTVEETAYWDEYAEWTDDRRTGERRLTQMWAGKPRLMLAKVAEALALRRAFPAQLGLLYTDAELGRDEPARSGVMATSAAEISGRPAPTPALAQPEQRRPVPKAPSPATGMSQWWAEVRAVGFDAESMQSAAQSEFGRAVQVLDADQLAALKEAALAGRIMVDSEGVWRVVAVGEDAQEGGEAEETI